MLFIVTGGCGFIGSHTVRHLCALGHRVRVFDNLSTGDLHKLDGLDVTFIKGDIRDGAALQSAFEGADRVIHLAARISVPESVFDPLGYDEVDTTGTLNVLMAAEKTGVKRVVMASSCSVYGSTPGLPKLESMPLKPESPYAACKAANEAYASAFAALGKVETVCLRYFNVFGPGQDPNGPYGAVIPSFVQRALGGGVLCIHGDGEQGRDFVAVTDVARANVLASLAEAGSGEVYNVGTGAMLTINAIADAVESLIEGAKREYGPKRAGDVRFAQASIVRAREDLGWEPIADFDAVLRDTIQDFKSRIQASNRVS